MVKKNVLTAVTAITVLLLVAALAWLTGGQTDPCANPPNDVSAAVLADESGDQDALINRAMILRALCNPESDP